LRKKSFDFNHDLNQWLKSARFKSANPVDRQGMAGDRKVCVKFFKACGRFWLTCQISSECVHCVGFQWPKSTILGNFWHMGGILYRSPFTDEGQIWCARADPWSTLTCHISPRLVYFVSFGGEKEQILIFYWLRHFVVSPIGGDLRKLNTGAYCITTNLRLCNSIKIVSVLKHLHGKIVHTNSYVKKCYGQKN